jgi:hypothetical protein
MPLVLVNGRGCPYVSVFRQAAGVVLKHRAFRTAAKVKSNRPCLSLSPTGLRLIALGIICSSLSS